MTWRTRAARSTSLQRSTYMQPAGRTTAAVRFEAVYMAMLDGYSRYFTQSATVAVLKRAR